MGSSFAYRQGTLHCEAVSLERIAARVGTPTYVYSRAGIESALAAFRRAFRGLPHTLCYSVKANSNQAVLRLVERQGAGFDVVSGGELARLLRAGVSTRRVVFSGVGKTLPEIDLALHQPILFFQVESGEELDCIAQRAGQLRRRARVALRVNPDVAVHTHPHIATGQREHKFGVPASEAIRLAQRAARQPWVEFVGLGCHIGSQIVRLEPFRRAVARLRRLAEELRATGLPLRYLDIGGGVGIRYQQEKTFRLRDYAALVRNATRGLGCHLVLEPGRSIVGPAGVLLARVLVRKRGVRRDFLVVDAGMNDLLRPALYGAYHHIQPVRQLRRPSPRPVDVVGPLCETGDVLGLDRRLPVLAPGELLAVCDAGAYGFVLASNYNSRPRAAEVLVSGRRWRVGRRRERWGELVRGESSAA